MSCRVVSSRVGSGKIVQCSAVKDSVVKSSEDQMRSDSRELQEARQDEKRSGEKNGFTIVVAILQIRVICYYAFLNKIHNRDPCSASLSPYLISANLNLFHFFLLKIL